MKIKGVNLKPVIITGKKGEEYCNYYLAGIYNVIHIWKYNAKVKYIAIRSRRGRGLVEVVPYSAGQ